MANLIDALIAADEEKLSNRPKTTMEIKRLSNALGVPFVLTLQAVSPQRTDEITENCIRINKRGKYTGTDLTAIKILTICEGVVSPDLNNAGLKKKLKAVTPKEVIQKLFTAGEIVDIFSAIQELSGLGDDDEEDNKETVKN